MYRIVGVGLICLAILGMSAQTAKGGSQYEADPEHTKWIDNTLRSIQRIKVGGTRSELLMVFTTEGGLSTASQRTYVYRHCPHIKVDVKFAAPGGGKELPTDKIVDISRPYLDWSIVD
jgi:hypothetical protein